MVRDRRLELLTTDDTDNVVCVWGGFYEKVR